MGRIKWFKKFISILICVFLLYILCSCYKNETYAYNKKILDTYETNDNYGFLFADRYEDRDKTIQYEKLVMKRVRRDGKVTNSRTRYGQYLANNNLYFNCEYRGVDFDDVHNYAVGYFDLTTNDIHIDYFESKYHVNKFLFSTNEFICYKQSYMNNSEEYTYAVFFKEDDKVIYDYDINKLVYNQEDIEETNLKDYYVENGIKYEIDYFERKLVNNELDITIQLPIYNEIMDKAPIIKEIYDKFKYDRISMLLTYISTGDELFFYIHDRPTNHLNAPYMVFKCDATFSNVTYIGYNDNPVIEIIKLK